MFAGDPAKVMVVPFTKFSVTPPPEPSGGAAKVPALAVKVTVILALSISAKLIADKFTLLSVSSVTVISEGTPEPVGASFAGVIEIFTVSAVPFTVPSLGVTVNTAVVVSFAAVV